MKYATIFRYANQDKIAATRPRHREYLTALHAQGKIVASGPFEDDSGALIIYEADGPEELEALITNDPFHEAGVFAAWTPRPWRQVF